MVEKKKIIVAFCMDLVGHFQRLVPVISSLANDFNIYFFADRLYQQQIEQAGAIFVDMLTPYPLAEADQESIPLGCRFVTYTGKYIEPILEEVKALQPSLIIYDSFAVIGFAVAKVLGLPFINICAGHNINAANIKERVKYHPCVKISTECKEAVVKLRKTYGIENADPFLYACSMSPYLNIYSEPPQFLDEEERKHYDPIAFFGCIDAEQRSLQGKKTAVSGCYFNPDARLKVYVSFGTIVWIYFTQQAAQVLQVISNVFADKIDTEVLISLGGNKNAENLLPLLKRDNIKVQFYVDQWAVLQEADLFITHHGLNSTHEAIYHSVPMLSYPFFWDQPPLAKKCQDLGVALPLVSEVREPLTEQTLRNSLKLFTAIRKKLQEDIRLLSQGEKQIVKDRGQVLVRIKNLVNQ